LSVEQPLFWIAAAVIAGAVLAAIFFLMWRGGIRD
jgi:hypothetical protein